MGRSNIKTVAERRLPEIRHFLVSLFNSADEIAHSDLVYTFFHPLLRDQQEQDIHVAKVKGNCHHNDCKMQFLLIFTFNIFFKKRVKFISFHSHSNGFFPFFCFLNLIFCFSVNLCLVFAAGLAEIRPTHPTERVRGEIKLSLQYHRGALTVMVSRIAPLVPST